MQSCRIVLLVLVSLNALGSQGHGQDEGVGKHALLVGVNGYADLPSLDFAVNDTEILKSGLKSIGFGEDDIVTLKTGATAASRVPTKANLERELRALANRARPRDMVIFSFSGHGLHLAGGAGSYLCPADSNLQQASHTMVPLEWVYQRLSESRASLRMMFVDACRNTPRGVVPLRNQQAFAQNLLGFDVNAGIVQMTSCAVGEVSFERPDLGNGNGVFTHFLAQGLREAFQRRNGREELTVLSLYTFVQQEATKKTEGKQTPTFRGVIQRDPRIAVRDQPQGDARPLLVSNPKRLVRIAAHRRPLSDIEFLDGGKAVSISSSPNARNVLTWDLREGRKVGETNFGNALRAIAVQPNGRDFAASNGRLLFSTSWPRQKRPVKTDLCHSNDSMAFSPDGKQLALGGRSGNVFVFNTRRGTLNEQGQHAKQVTTVAFSHDGRYLAVGSQTDENVRVWDLAGKEAVRDFNLPGVDRVWRVRFAPDRQGDLLTIAGNKKALSVSRWRFKERREIAAATIENLPGPPLAVDVSPDWGRIATGHKNGSVYILNPSTGQVVHFYPGGLGGHEQEVTALQLSPDGQQLLSGDRKGVIIHWTVP